MSDQLYTLDEARRELDRQQCRSSGYDWDILETDGSETLAGVVCSRCGRSYAIDSGAAPEIDYEHDWAGEVRIDPTDGNGYVLRAVEGYALNDFWVRVNDVLGGHERRLTLLTWLGWKRNS